MSLSDNPQCHLSFRLTRDHFQSSNWIDKTITIQRPRWDDCQHRLCEANTFSAVQDLQSLLHDHYTGRETLWWSPCDELQCMTELGPHCLAIGTCQSLRCWLQVHQNITWWQPAFLNRRLLLKESYLLPIDVFLQQLMTCSLLRFPDSAEFSFLSKVEWEVIHKFPSLDNLTIFLR